MPVTGELVKTQRPFAYLKVAKNGRNIALSSWYKASDYRTIRQLVSAFFTARRRLAKKTVAPVSLRYQFSASFPGRSFEFADRRV